MERGYSVVIPAFNEAGAIEGILKELVALAHKRPLEIIVVNDASTDGTLEKAQAFPVRTLSNIQNFGYGYSLKRGIREATHDHIIILDADGSYPVASLPALIAAYEKGFDMVVGARGGLHYFGSAAKRLARFFFRVMSEFATGQRIPDINSGCRIFRKDAALRFFHTLSSGFSFTTTITLAFMLNGYSVGYLPIEYHKRGGHSKVRYVRDTLRSAQIIVEAITYYNPLKIFVLCGGILFLAGIASLSVLMLHPLLAILVFLTIALPVTILCLGLVAVLLKFIHNDAKCA